MKHSSPAFGSLLVKNGAPGNTKLECRVFPKSKSYFILRKLCFGVGNVDQKVLWSMLDTSPQSTLEPLSPNPLVSNNAADWQNLVADLNPPALLLFIESRMSDKLRLQHSPEDIYQEALSQAWGERESIEWKGVRAFRVFVKVLVERVIVDLANHDGRLKRTDSDSREKTGNAPQNGSRAVRPLGELPAATATPSRAAIYRERAAAMQAALDRLPYEQRELLRMRIIEDQQLEDIARAMGIGMGAVRHRLFRAAEAYAMALNAGRSRG